MSDGVGRRGKRFGQSDDPGEGTPWKALLPVGKSGSPVSGRPVANFTLALNQMAGGENVFGYRLANVAIHYLCSLLLFGVVKRTLARRGGRSGAEAGRLALTVAGLWAAHPLASSAVVYLSQRTELLVSLFVLLSLYGLARAAGTADGRGWRAVCVGSAWLAVASKEVGAVVPLLVLGYDWLFGGGPLRAVLRRRPVFYGLLAGSWLLQAALVISSGNRGDTAGMQTGLEWWVYGLTQIWAIGQYLRLAFWPDRLVFDYGSMVIRDPGEIWGRLLVVLGLLGLTLWALRRRWPISYAGLAFFLLLLPSSSLIPVATQTVGEHRFYLPLAAMVGLLVLAAYQWLGKSCLLFAVPLACVLCAATVQRVKVYGDLMTLWTDTLQKQPDNDRAHNNFGNLLMKAGDVDGAFAHYSEALRLFPGDYEALANIASVYVNRGDYDRAIDLCRQALELEPACLNARLNLASALARARRLDEAIAQYRILLQAAPNHAEAHYYLANALIESGRPAEAMSSLQAAVQARPGWVEPLHKLAVLEAQNQQISKAIADFQQVLEWQPDYPLAARNLGAVLLRERRFAEAVPLLLKAVAAEPSSPAIRYSLGLAYEGMGNQAEAQRCFDEARARAGASPPPATAPGNRNDSPTPR